MSRLDEIKARFDDRTYSVADHRWMAKRIERLESALNFYATGFHHGIAAGPKDELMKDYGLRASQALEEE